MIGIEFGRDRTTKDRAPALRDRIVQLAFERGVLVLREGKNSIRLRPPLVLTPDQPDSHPMYWKSA